MSNVTIREIKTILTAPRGIDLVVVKIETSEPGLHGVGCATFTQRFTAVATAVNDYLKPLLEGRSVDNIEDIWQSAAGNSYWRNGPVLNNAISGVDQALWDIKGKMANMPVYELLGGKCREAAAVYRHAGGASPEEVEESVRRYMGEGYRYIRCQMGAYGGQTENGAQTIASPDGSLPGAYYDPAQYMRDTLRMFDHVRGKLGFDSVELLHDVHERLSPVQALRFAKELEPIGLFFLEDALPPEQVEWFADLRRQVATPLAMGELFNHPLEWKNLIAQRLIDYIRVHVSQIGGLTPAKKLAALCEAFGVRTAWHGPGDTSPVGMAAQLHLDLAVPNFGIQEFSGFSDEEREVFPGCPEVRNGFMYPNASPGYGIDLDEAKAKLYPCALREHGWLKARLPDGTAVRA
ncbi:MAG: starvation-sensing protein RspA [Clostridiales bacterium]|jgi:mannonate dehydratase|nr:starvation-sensing protein RspA [Clostridiales bacterium]